MFSSLQPTKKYFVITFLISCILLEVFTLVIYNQFKVNKDSNQWVIHSYEVMRIGRLALVDSIDLSNAEQDYILTGYANHLDDYKTSLAKLNTELALLYKAVSDNPEQERNAVALTDKIEQLKRISAVSIEAMQQGHGSFYSMKNNSAAIKQTIAEIRAGFEEFSQKEAELLDKRSKSANQDQEDYLWTLFVGALLGLGALIVANLVIFSLINKGARTEEKLRKSEELFSTIINGLNDGIFDYNLNNGSIYYSQAYRAMLGYSQEKLDYLSQDHDRFYSHMHPDDTAPVQEMMRQFLAGEIPTYYMTFRMRHENGHWVWIMSRGIIIKDEAGNPQRMIGTHTDISVQKQREEELNYFIQENDLQRQQLAMEKERAETASTAKSDFLATMSHEIRTPLNAVIGLSRLLLGTKLDAKQHEMIDTLHVNADVLLRLVNDLLDISRIESGQVELEERSFTLESVFRALHAMLDSQASAKGLTLIMKNEVGDGTYRGDPTRIQQVMANLIGNALKFTTRGTIKVLAEAKDHQEDITHIHISVSDTGVGIAPEKLSVVFDKFVQADQTISRRFGGSGLGLAICKSLAQIMGGDISVNSQPGVGSVFTFNFPLKRVQQKTTAVAPLPASAAVPQTGKVLIVEDYAPNIMVATLMLEHLGYTADIAKDGAEALAKIRDAKTPYLAILMDVQMQDMDGYETTRRLRVLEKEKNMHHFIIGVTAHALAGDRQHCLDAGMDDYMSKPIHPDLLAQKLEGLSRAA